MFRRNLNILISSLSDAGKHKCFDSSPITNCRFFAAKSQLKSDNVSSTTDTLNNKRKIIKLPFNDPKLSQIMLKLKSKKMRERSNLMYFEGKRLLCDALEAGIVPLRIYFSSSKDIYDIDIPNETTVMKIPYNELKVWSDMTTCPGVLTICRIPEPVEDYSPSIPVSVIFDNVREPGNVGALIRNCAGAGAEEVFLTEGCVDLWDPKVIRGGMGTHFRLPIYNEYSWKSIKESLNKNTLLLMATNKKYDCAIENIMPYYKVDYFNHEHISLIIGGETEGISDSAFKLMNNFNFKVITIPLSNCVESLNCVSALSVILFEIKRQFSLLMPEIGD